MKVSYLYEGNPFGKLSKKTPIQETPKSKLADINADLTKNMIAKNIYKPIYDFLLSLGGSDEWSGLIKSLELDFTCLNHLSSNGSIEYIFNDLEDKTYLSFLKNYFRPIMTELHKTGVLKIPCICFYNYRNLDFENAFFNKKILKLIHSSDEIKELNNYIANFIQTKLKTLGYENLINGVKNVKIIIIPSFLGGPADNKSVHDNIKYIVNDNTLTFNKLLTYYNTNIQPVVESLHDNLIVPISMFKSNDDNKRINEFSKQAKEMQNIIDISLFFSYINVEIQNIGAYSNNIIFENINEFIELINYFKNKNNIVAQYIQVKCKVNSNNNDNDDIITTVKKSLDNIPFIKDKIIKLFNAADLNVKVVTTGNDNYYTDDKFANLSRINASLMPLTMYYQTAGKMLVYGDVDLKQLPVFKNSYYAYNTNNDESIGDKNIIENWVNYYNELNIAIPITITSINKFNAYLKMHGKRDVFLVDDNDINSLIDSFKAYFMNYNKNPNPQAYGSIQAQRPNAYTIETINKISNKLGESIKKTISKTKASYPDAVTSDGKLIVLEFNQPKPYSDNIKNKNFVLQADGYFQNYPYVDVVKRTVSFEFKLQFKIGFKNPLTKFKFINKKFKITFKLDEL